MNRFGVTSTGRQWLRAIFVLALFAFAILPAMDRFLCANDGIAAAATPAAAHATVKGATVPADPGSPAELCAHGHCHEASVSTPDWPELATTPVIHAAFIAPPASLGLPSVSPPGLMRPPRA